MKRSPERVPRGSFCIQSRPKGSDGPAARYAFVSSSTWAKASAKMRALLRASSRELPAAPTYTSMEPRDLCWL